MAKINTLNYQTVASWNGSQDLFVVEQPDGTKVATPSMIKQFIEAGDFEATGEVKDGHGNILSAVVEQVSQLDDEIGALIKTQEFSGTLASLAGNTDATVSIPVTIPNGYKILGIAAAVAGSRNIAITGTLIGTNSVSTYVYNLFSTAFSNIRVYVVVEFIKI